MPQKLIRNLSAIVTLLLIAVSTVVGDQLLRWGVDHVAYAAVPHAADFSLPPPRLIPASLLGPAMAAAAFHRLDRSAEPHAFPEAVAE